MSAQGFSPRERNGIISLAIIVVVCLAIGFLGDNLRSCGRIDNDKVVFDSDSPTVEDSFTGMESEKFKNSESRKNGKRSGVSKSKDSSAKIGKTRKKKRSSKIKTSETKNKNTSSNSSRRNLRDEEIPSE